MIKGEIRLASSEKAANLPEGKEWKAVDEIVFFSHAYRNTPAHPVSRLVLIRWLMEDDEDMAQAALVEVVTDQSWEFDPDTVGPQDAYLDKAETGLPFSLIIEMDTTAPVLGHQLSKPLGTIPDELMNRLENLWSRPSKTDMSVGVDWTKETNDKHKKRREWKEQELQDVYALGRASLSVIFEDE